MIRPSDRDYHKAVHMMHSGQLDYESANLCLEVMKAYLSGKMIRLDDLNQFKHLLQINETRYI